METNFPVTIIITQIIISKILLVSVVENKYLCK